MNRRGKKSKLNDIVAGQLPDEMLYRTLEIKADPGEVRLTRAAQSHIQSRHPGELEKILPRLSQLVENPLYMGDDHRNPGKIELVGRVPQHSGAVLVAILLDRNEGEDFYHICSAYFISQAEVDKRRDQKILKNAL